MTLKFIKRNIIIVIIEILVFFYGLFTFNSSDFLPYALFSIYMILVLSYSIQKSLNIYDPRDLFLFMTLLGFGIGYPFFYHNPTKLYFFNDSAYSTSFNFEKSDLNTSFILFIFSAVFFYLGTFLKIKIPIIRINLKVSNVKTISILSLIIVSLFSFFRLYYKINLPGYNEIAFPFVGYIYNPGIYLVNILIVFCVFLGFKSLNFHNILLSLIPGLVNGFALGVMGIKSGLIFNFIMILVLFQMLKNGGLNFNSKLKFSLSVISVLALVIIYIVYSFIGYYRLVLMVNDYNVSQINFNDLVMGFLNSFNDINDSFGDYDNFAIFKRISGINYLVPIVSFFKQSFLNADVSLIRNIFDAYSINPEMYLTNTILGVPKSVISTNAPGGIGAFYIYGGFLYCAVGMFLLGFLIMNLYLFTWKNILHSDFLLVLYTIFLVQIFLPVTFEGTIINFLKTNIPSFIIALALFYIFLKFINFFQRIKLG